MVLGLGPAGTRSFALVQEGLEVRLERSPSGPGGEVPLPPRVLLSDLHHAFFLGPASGAPSTSGWRPTARGDEVVYAERADGDWVLAFAPRPGAPPTVTVSRSLAREGALPRRVVLERPRAHYRLEVETVSYRPLR
ncbi:MAG: hypothetical protein D6731_17795 [Planctomycetota bacterium]|nr:MAG: hypothetical protein D6731_17795 [Planctomycetota bacterium]